MNTVIVLDFENAEVVIFKTQHDENEGVEEDITDRGMSVGNCEYMVVKEPLKLRVE